MRLGLVAVTALLLTGCSHTATTPGPTDGSSLNFDSKATIVVDDSGFQPSVTKAHVGDALTVTNRGTKDHGLSSDTIDTGVLRPGESTIVFLTDAKTVQAHDRTDPSHTTSIEVAPAASS
jgi:hypothetical protein